MSHTLQVTIRPAYVHFDALFGKLRQLFGRIRKFSVAVEMIIEKRGKSVVSDGNTR